MKKQTSHLPTLQLPDLMNSVTSETSISNFVAQTPKQNKLGMNFKKVSHQSKVNQQKQKQNNLQVANFTKLQNPNKKQLPYKMITSELPAPCLNHPEKQSSFYIESDEHQPIYYCEKCAILVASQGFQVKKIQSNCKQKISLSNALQNNNSSRLSIKDTKTIKKSKMNEFISKQQKQTQLTNFLNNIQRIQARINKIYETNQVSIVQIQSATQSQGHKIKQLFLNLHKVLDEIEGTYFYQLQTKNQQMREPLQHINEELNNDTSTLQSMKQDICQAYDDIINQTTNAQFETVMNAYKQNSQQIQNALNTYEGQNISLRTPLKQVQIEIKSDQIIHQLQTQIISHVQSTKRLSVKSTKRRMSIGGGSKIR